MEIWGFHYYQDITEYHTSELKKTENKLLNPVAVFSS